MTSRPYPYFLYPATIHSLLFFYLPFHTSQEQDEMAHGLLLMIRYWYMRIGIAIVEKPFADSVDPPDAPHENSGALSSPHSHDGLSDGPGPKEPRRRSPSSSDRGIVISRVQPSPRKTPLHRFSMSRAERSTLPSRTLASNSLLTSLGFRKTSRLPAEETCRITTRGPTSGGTGRVVGGVIGSLPTDSVATSIVSEASNSSDVTVRSPLFSCGRNSKYCGWNAVRLTA